MRQWETTVGLELWSWFILTVEFGEEHAHAEKECGDSRTWCGYYLVTTRDVLSFALATSDSCQTKSASVFVVG